MLDFVQFVKTKRTEQRFKWSCAIIVQIVYVEVSKSDVNITCIKVMCMHDFVHRATH